jgi:hypothetical protein
MVIREGTSQRRALLLSLGLRPGVGFSGCTGEVDLSLTTDVGLCLVGSAERDRLHPLRGQ